MILIFEIFLQAKFEHHFFENLIERDDMSKLFFYVQKTHILANFRIYSIIKLKVQKIIRQYTISETIRWFKY